MSDTPAKDIIRFLRGDCGGDCLCGRLCGPCSGDKDCGLTSGIVGRVLPEQIVLRDGRALPQTRTALRPGQRVTLTCDPEILHWGKRRAHSTRSHNLLWVPENPVTYSVSAPLPERWPGAGLDTSGEGTLIRHDGWLAQEALLEEGRGVEFAGALGAGGTLRAITILGRGALRPGAPGWALLHEISAEGVYTSRLLDPDIDAAGAMGMFNTSTGASTTLPGGGLLTMGFSYTIVPDPEQENTSLYDELRVHTYTISPAGVGTGWTSAPLDYLSGRTLASQDLGRSNPAPELGAIYWTLLDGTILKVTPGAAVTAAELPDQALRIAEPGTFAPPVDVSEVEVPISEAESTAQNLHVFRRINPTLRSFQVATQTLSATVMGTEDLGGGWTLLQLDHVPAGVVAQWPSEPRGVLLPHLPGLMVLDLDPAQVPTVVTWNPDYAPTLVTGNSTVVQRLGDENQTVEFDPGTVPHVIAPEPLTGVELFPTAITGIADLAEIPQVPALSGRPAPELLWEVPEGGGQMQFTFPPAPEHARGAVISLAIRTDWEALADDGGDLWIGDGGASRHLSHTERGWFIVTRPVTGTENFTLKLTASIPLTVEIGQLSIIHTVQEGI